MIMCQLGAKSSSVIIISGTERRTAMGSSHQLRRDERFGSRYFATLVACDSLRGGGAQTFRSSRKITSIVIMWYCLQGYTMNTL